MRLLLCLFGWFACFFVMVSCHPTPQHVQGEKRGVLDTADNTKENYFRYLDIKGVTYDYPPIDHICQYDAIIRAEAEKIGWDWRLLASIIYQESHFKPDLINEKGAFGLMQLMPVTMEKYGIDYESSVEEQLEAAGKLLLFFDRELPESINDSIERGKFILASYNAGLGNVLKARTKAEKRGKNPDVWTKNVEEYAPKQTFYFVREILKRYSYYKKTIK